MADYGFNILWEAQSNVFSSDQYPTVNIIFYLFIRYNLTNFLFFSLHIQHIILKLIAV